MEGPPANVPGLPEGVTCEVIGRNPQPVIDRPDPPALRKGGYSAFLKPEVPPQEARDLEGTSPDLPQARGQLFWTVDDSPTVLPRAD